MTVLLQTPDHWDARQRVRHSKVGGRCLRNGARIRGQKAGSISPLSAEKVRLQFRTDFFNLFNHTNFANPAANQSDANFGKISQTVGTAVATGVGTTASLVGGGPRVIQLSLCLEF